MYIQYYNIYVLTHENFFFKFESAEKNILIFELKEPIFFKLNFETIIEVIVF